MLQFGQHHFLKDATFPLMRIVIFFQDSSNCRSMGLYVGHQFYPIGQWICFLASTNLLPITTAMWCNLKSGMVIGHQVSSFCGSCILVLWWVRTKRKTPFPISVKSYVGIMWIALSLFIAVVKWGYEWCWVWPSCVLPLLCWERSLRLYRTFIIKRCWNLFKAFSASNKMTM